MSSPVDLWQVYHLFCRHTKPHPKNKLIVVMCFDTMPMGFLINSRINAYVKNQPHLMKCEVMINQSDHAFLKYDSFVDCRDIFPFSVSELTDMRGYIAPTAQSDILKAVAACSVLPRHYKLLIDEAHNPT